MDTQGLLCMKGIRNMADNQGSFTIGYVPMSILAHLFQCMPNILPNFKSYASIWILEQSLQDDARIFPGSKKGSRC